MIQLDPGETENYFMLAKIYDDAGVYQNEEDVLLKAKEIKPNDPLVYMNLAGYYKRQGQTEKMIKATEDRAAREPNNPEAHYTVATFYWDEAFRDTTLKENQKREYLQRGHRRDRQGAANQAGLLRGAGDQGTAAAPPGEHGEGRGQAE